jgi:2,4-dienoyl-CoA reductase-like NADH-dependent reductase (Old Yellow Enzyme family)
MNSRFWLVTIFPVVILVKSLLICLAFDFHSMKPPQLFSPLKIRGLTLRNRVGVSPMCQYISKDGFISVDWTLCHLGSMAAGGAALVMSEATAISPVARITHGCAGIWCDEQIAGWTRVNEFCHSMRAVTGIQLAHAGRKVTSDVKE